MHRTRVLGNIRINNPSRRLHSRVDISSDALSRSSVRSQRRCVPPKGLRQIRFVRVDRHIGRAVDAAAHDVDGLWRTDGFGRLWLNFGFEFLVRLFDAGGPGRHEWFVLNHDVVWGRSASTVLSHFCWWYGEGLGYSGHCLIVMRVRLEHGYVHG